MAMLFAGQASAAPAPGAYRLEKPCILLGHPQADPIALLRGEGAFDCALDPRKADAATVWVRYDLSGVAVDAQKGWIYNHTQIQADDEQVWIMHADGRVRKSATARENARRILGGPTQGYAFPADQGRITGLLIRMDGLENRRGPVPRAALTSDADAAANQATINLIFGVLAGILVGILFYNLTLYAVLRHRALAAFCWPIIGNLFYGLVWSNLIVAIFPAMSTATQFGWNALSICFCFAATGYYFKIFIEPGLISERLHRLHVITGVFAMAVCVLKLLPVPFPWQAFDAVLYVSVILMAGLLLCNWGVAIHRKSKAIWFFIFAWIIPFLVVFSRILWGMGSIKTESALFDATSFIAMSIQAMFSAVALSWRFRVTQDERDEALNLAETDPLSGLFNRRAFLAAVQKQEVPLKLVLVDIDHFKAINDQHGHDVGDQAIIAVSRILRNFSPDEAIVGRLGGEEFAVIVPDNQDNEIAERLRRVVARADILPGGARLTISAGVSFGFVADENDWRRLYIAADSALYEAKRTGRNKVSVALPSDDRGLARPA